MGSDAVKEERNGNSLKIKTLTPLWTGDIRGNSTYVKETSIIGSLRWWYEALVRGLGGHACDITSDNPKERCDYERDKGKICDACKLFGCTGYSRRFRLEVVPKDNQLHNLFFVTSDLEWWLRTIFEHPEQVAFGKFELKLHGKDKYLKSIEALLFFLSEYGGIGARNQYGFGQFKISGSDLEKECRENWIKLTKTKFSPKDNNHMHWENLPSMKNFLFLKYKIDESSAPIGEFTKGIKFRCVKEIPKDFRWMYIPVSLDLRYKGILEEKPFGIRYYFREKERIGRTEDRDIFGCMTNENKNSSKINVSHLYKENEDDDHYFLKIWGILPKQCSYTPQNFLKKVKIAIPKEFENFDEKTGKDIVGDSQ